MLVILGASGVAAAIGIFGMMAGPPLADSFVQAQEGLDRKAKAGGTAMAMAGVLHEELVEVESDFFTGEGGRIKMLLTPSEVLYLGNLTLTTLKTEEAGRFLADVWGEQSSRRAS